MLFYSLHSFENAEAYPVKDKVLLSACRIVVFSESNAFNRFCSVSFEESFSIIHGISPGDYVIEDDCMRLTNLVVHGDMSTSVDVSDTAAVLRRLAAGKFNPVIDDKEIWQSRFQSLYHISIPCGGSLFCRCRQTEKGMGAVIYAGNRGDFLSN